MSKIVVCSCGKLRLGKVWTSGKHPRLIVELMQQEVATEEVMCKTCIVDEQLGAEASQPRTITGAPVGIRK